MLLLDKHRSKIAVPTEWTALRSGTDGTESCLENLTDWNTLRRHRIWKIPFLPPADRTSVGVASSALKWREGFTGSEHESLPLKRLVSGDGIARCRALTARSIPPNTAAFLIRRASAARELTVTCHLSIWILRNGPLPHPEHSEVAPQWTGLMWLLCIIGQVMIHYLFRRETLESLRKDPGR
jgi:hypothetical protein